MRIGCEIMGTIYLALQLTNLHFLIMQNTFQLGRIELFFNFALYAFNIFARTAYPVPDSARNLWQSFRPDNN